MSRSWTVLLVGAAIAAGGATASAGTTRKLIVTLDAPSDALPELFCIVGAQKCTGNTCAGLSELRDAMTFAGTSLTFGDQPAPLALRSEPLRDALAALGREHGRACSQCRPSVTLIEHIGTPESLKGYVTCARNSRTTHSDRVAVSFLRFHRFNVPAPIGGIELLGNQLTVHFSHPIDVDDYELLSMIGGDYLPDTTGVGTKERMLLGLNPRCTLTPIVLPPRVHDPEDQTRSVLLDATPIDRCVEDHAGTTSVWLPYQPAGRVRQLWVELAGARSTTSYEASWIDPAPPRPLELRYRQLELSWRKDCLVGSLPASSSTEWSSSCPRATLPAAGARCELVGPTATTDSHCSYRCTAPTTMPAFELPTPVQFDRYGRWSINDIRKAYSWNDSLAYSGQELTSFTPAAERRVIVELADPAAWRSRHGNEIWHVGLRAGTGATHNVAIGAWPARWAVVAIPNAACSEPLAIEVAGARNYHRRNQILSEYGNLVLRAPSYYRHRFHWALTLGGGVLLPTNIPTEARFEPYGSLGGGFELDLSRPISGSLGFTLLYEPTRTASGVAKLEGAGRLGTTSYHRVVAELAATGWGTNRNFELGMVVGAGVGSGTASDPYDLGSLRPFALTGLVGRIKPFDVKGWFDLSIGVRWGEQLELVDDNGQPITRLRHQPIDASFPLAQLYAQLRWRAVFR